MDWIKIGGGRWVIAPHRDSFLRLVLCFYTACKAKETAYMVCQYLLQFPQRFCYEDRVQA